MSKLSAINEKSEAMRQGATRGFFLMGREHLLCSVEEEIMRIQVREEK